MFARNTDEGLLESRRINARDPRSPLEQALRIALYDEWHAMATYEAVIARFGPVRPFVNIVQAEANHASAIIRQMQRYGFQRPVNDWAGKVRLPATLKECCAEGVAGEIDNAAMYDDFLSYPLPPEVARLFERLKNASQNNHLPAFQRCLSGMGQNRQEGRDMGHGSGHGAGPMRGAGGQGAGGGHGQGHRMRRGQGGGNCGSHKKMQAHQGASFTDQADVRPAAASASRTGVGAGLALAGAALLGVGALVRMARKRQTSGKA
ncbi:ferritin-like domain-containing protein [Xanthobacter sp. TB0139]|uniref:ferritin-like domain-containing protein n=1 Tax=Xanthobacter sp. TB0139 TaxID=3459178 RepID=UPI00403A0246